MPWMRLYSASTPAKRLASTRPPKPRSAPSLPRHLSRRDALRGLLAGAAVAGLASTMTSRVALAAGSTLAFAEIAHGPQPGP